MTTFPVEVDPHAVCNFRRRSIAADLMPDDAALLSGREQWPLAAVRETCQHPFITGLPAPAGEDNRLVEGDQPKFGLDANHRRFDGAQAAVPLVKELGFRQRAQV